MLIATPPGAYKEHMRNVVEQRVRGYFVSTVGRDEEKEDERLE